MADPISVRFVQPYQHETHGRGQGPQWEAGQVDRLRADLALWLIAQGIAEDAAKPVEPEAPRRGRPAKPAKAEADEGGEGVKADDEPPADKPATKPVRTDRF